MTIEENQLNNYYKDAELPEGTMDAILSAGVFAAEAKRWRRIAVSSSVGIVLVAVLAGWLFVRGERFREMVAQQPQPDPGQEIVPVVQPLPQKEEGEVPTQAEPRFRFVAFRSHDDGCPHCRATGELFVDVKSKFSKGSVDFDKFELQDEENLKETMTRIESQNLTQLVAGKAETAFAVLLSPRGNLLQQFDSRSGIENVSAAISEIIDQ